MKQWNQIIKAAENKEPNSPFSVTCLNLALAKTGQLGDRMFHFYQNGTEGLTPTSKEISPHRSLPARYSIIWE